MVKGITARNLFSKIDQMCEKRLICPDVRDGVHEVRHLGNDMAHVDLIQYVSPEEADLLREVLVEVYQSPARVERPGQTAERDHIAAAMAEGKPLYSGAVSGIQQALLQLMSITRSQLVPPQPEGTS